MRNHTLVIAITILICLTSSGKLQAGTADAMARPERAENDARAISKDGPATKTERAARRDRVRRLEGKAPDASKPAVSSARLKLPPNALASDPAVPLKTAPPMPVQDGSSWTGFYAGGHGGSGWGQENSVSPLGPRP
jgi:hypothetical protein